MLSAASASDITHRFLPDINAFRADVVSAVQSNNEPMLLLSLRFMLTAAVMRETAQAEQAVIRATAEAQQAVIRATGPAEQRATSAEQRATAAEQRAAAAEQKAAVAEHKAAPAEQKVAAAEQRAAAAEQKAAAAEQKAAEAERKVRDTEQRTERKLRDAELKTERKLRQAEIKMERRLREAESSLVEVARQNADSMKDLSQVLVAERTKDTQLENSPPRVKRSFSRAQAWNQAIGMAQNRSDETLPHIPTRVNRPRPNDSVVLEQLATLACPDENAMDYKGVAELLQQYFACSDDESFGTIHVLDTHRQMFLNDLAPDVVIQRSTSFADKFNVAVVIDLKSHRAKTRIGTASNYGQILDYLVELQRCQPGRSMFVGLLTNLHAAYVITYSVRISKGKKPDIQLRHYRKSNLANALYTVRAILSTPEANPPKLPFSKEAGTLKYVLQRHSHSVVAVFQKHGHTQNMVVKAPSEVQWRHSINSEISVLELLNSIPNRPISIPALVYSHNRDTDVPELGITPVGQPFTLAAFATAQEARLCLEDILVAIAWVHEQGLVHRDIRLDNVVIFHELPQEQASNKSPQKDSASAGTGATTAAQLAAAASELKARRLGRKRGLLIDFDHATKIGTPCFYEGGYICCPPELLRREYPALSDPPELLWPEPYGGSASTSSASASLDMDRDVDMDARGSHSTRTNPSGSLANMKYTPRAAHDYLAFVLLLNTLIFSFGLERFTYHRVDRAGSRERDRLLALWDALRGSTVWGGMVRAAEEECKVVGVWRGFLSLVTWL